MRTVYALAAATAGLLLTAVGGPAQPPQVEVTVVRPAELDLLQPFVGRWQQTGTIRIPGREETVEFRAGTAAGWECDRWFLLERGTFQIGSTQFGQGLAVWTWDPQSRMFRTWQFESPGKVSVGTARYVPEQRRWTLRTSGWSLVTGQSTVGEGTIEMRNDDETHWTWVEWGDAQKQRKLFEMTGTSRRQK